MNHTEFSSRGGKVGGKSKSPAKLAAINNNLVKARAAKAAKRKEKIK